MPNVMDLEISEWETENIIIVEKTRPFTTSFIDAGSMVSE
jgi:hypothetical protein